ncbi:MAG: hypothetical protein V8Q71_02335 [Bacilli bacterium]
MTLLSYGHNIGEIPGTDDLMFGKLEDFASNDSSAAKGTAIEIMNKIQALIIKMNMVTIIWRFLRLGYTMRLAF